MRNAWIGLSAFEHRDEVRRALSTYDPGACVSFTGSARELRHWAQESCPAVGVVVGMTEEGISGINVAAAVVRDGAAADVVLVCKGGPDSLAQRARRAGITTLIDVDAVDEAPSDCLDEPVLPDDDVPTMVMGVLDDTPMARLSMVPTIEDNVTPLPAAHDRPALRPAPKELTLRPAPKEPALRPASKSPASRPAPKEPALPLPAPARDGVGSRDGSPTVRTTPGTTTRAPVLVLVSGRGGVGKTTVAAAMAFAASTWGLRVSLLDLDLACGNLYSCFGTRGPADFSSLAGKEGLDEKEFLACGRELSDNLTLWGSCDKPELAEAAGPLAGPALETLARTSDLVIVDTSTTFTDAVAQAAQSCDRLLLVVDGRAGSAVAQTRLGALAVRLGVARTRIVRVANRCGPRGKGGPDINRADVGLETARTLSVLEGGPEVNECMGEGRAAELFDFGSRFAESCSICMANLLKELGALPDDKSVQKLLDRQESRPRWSFGRRKEAV